MRSKPAKRMHVRDVPYFVVRHSKFATNKMYVLQLDWQFSPDISTIEILQLFTHVYLLSKAVFAFLGFEVFTAVTMMNTIFLDVTPCSLIEVYHRFEGAFCLHLQYVRISLTGNHQAEPWLISHFRGSKCFTLYMRTTGFACYSLFAGCLLCLLFDLEGGEVWSTEASVYFYQTTRCRILENINSVFGFRSHRSVSSECFILTFIMQ
jgi:hypothetical protein